MKPKLKIGIIIGLLVVAYMFFLNFRSIDKDYNAVLLTKDFNEKEKLNIHLLGEKSFELLEPPVILGQITIQDKTYKVILEKDNNFDIYSGELLDSSHQLSKSKVGEIYLSKNYRDIYCYFKEEDVFVISPISKMENIKNISFRK